jgi:hypothetical protein
MKKIKLFSIIFFLFQAILCNAQKKEIRLEYQNDNLIKELGIGLVQLVNPNEKIILYNDSSCKIIKTNQAKLGKDIIPLLNKPDYNILFFVCVEKSSKFYKIISTSGKYVYVKPSEKYLFYEWDNFFKSQVIYFDNTNKKLNPMLDRIDGKTIDINNLDYYDDDFEIVDVKNNWININNLTKKKKYWIKWKEKNKLLGTINLLI